MVETSLGPSQAHPIPLSLSQAGKVRVDLGAELHDWVAIHILLRFVIKLQRRQTLTVYFGHYLAWRPSTQSFVEPQLEVSGQRHGTTNSNYKKIISIIVYYNHLIRLAVVYDYYNGFSFFRHKALTRATKYGMITRGESTDMDLSYFHELPPFVDLYLESHGLPAKVMLTPFLLPACRSRMTARFAATLRKSLCDLEAKQQIADLGQAEGETYYKAAQCKSRLQIRKRVKKYGTISDSAVANSGEMPCGGERGASHKFPCLVPWDQDSDMWSS
ncbi:hypothetical protein EDB87DRAFT_1825150 [Lactarius vividus]|nr:hypothetical protein EDB87DRAFT_1825150 [Lactarius vividus]